MQLSYMGTKRWLAPKVAALAAEAKNGPFLDLFSGMCTVASELRGSRSCWSNDAQPFAANVGAALLTSAEVPMSSHRVATMLYADYLANREALVSRWKSEVSDERELLAKAAIGPLRRFEAEFPSVASSLKLSQERSRLSRLPGEFPFRLASITYSAGYFGLDQSVQIDSIRFAIDAHRSRGAITGEQHRWLCLALCVAAKRIATTTGHFAQHLVINANNGRRFISQRRRSGWGEWLAAIDEVVPMGTAHWRQSNKAYQVDALELLRQLKEHGSRPSVVYADPPYTKDQYSRYYHVLDSLLRYDYPEASGAGRYPSERFISRFSRAATVMSAMEELISRVARSGATLILSYPKHALLKDSTNQIRGLLKEHFNRFVVKPLLTREHSTLGASKGKVKKTSDELLFVAS